MSVKVNGYDQVKGRLARAKKNTAAIPEVAQEWVDVRFKPKAKLIVPVKSGDLQRSIDGEVTPTSVIVFADTPYAQWVEEGTVKMPAQPYLWPALASTYPYLLKDIAIRIMQ